MKQLNNYIIEKLRINKDTQLNQTLDTTTLEKIVTWLCGEYADWSIEDFYSQIFKYNLINMSKKEFEKYIEKYKDEEIKFELTKDKLIFFPYEMNKTIIQVSYSDNIEDAIKEIAI